jgi:hypothetical protein
MPKVRSNGAQRWATRTAAATPDYQAGVGSPRVPWQQATIAAKEVHKAATTQALQEDRFAKGVAKAGDGKWQAAAQGKGAERFGPGAAAGVNDYQQGVAPYLAVIEGTQLPPRGPKGDPRNIERVRVLAAALRAKKVKGFSLLPVLIVLALVGVTLCLIFGGEGLGRSRSQTLGGHSRNAVHGFAVARPTTWAAGVVLGALGTFLFLGAALDLVSASVTAAAAGGAAMAAVAGDSLAVRNAPFDAKPQLLTMWIKSQTSGFAQITHPSGHDQVRDIRVRHVAAANLPLFAPGLSEPLEPQELISATLGAGAVAGDIELLHALMYYPTLPGIEARFIGVDELINRASVQVTVEDTTTATAGGAYSGSRALNAASDLLRANTDFAILGAHIGALAGALTIRGVDTGNLRVGIPAMAGRPDLTGQWFVFLTEQFGLPLIPVINSANKAAVFIENVQDENLAAVPFSLLMMELTPG